MDRLVLELIDEAQYLLNDKGMEIIVETSPYDALAAEIPARIVIGNLTRNAFQHTWQGKVRITQVEGRVEITNDVLDEVESVQDFGWLGLQLSEQLCARLGWPLRGRREPGRHHASILLPGP